MNAPTQPDSQYTLDQLTTLAGVPRRTVRYYIQLGLVDRPVGETRAAYYTWQHLKQLLEVRGYTEQGFRSSGSANCSAAVPSRPQT